MQDGQELFDDSGKPDTKVLKANDFEALARARNGIAEAQGEAQAIIARAHEEAEAIRIAAHHEGQQQSAALVAEYSARMHREVVESHDTLTKIVMNALRRILKPIPTAKLVAGAVARAVEEADIGRGATLIVAPPLMNTLREQFQLRGIAPEVLEVRGDPDCPLESSILRSEFGDIELGIEFQLRAIEHGLQMADKGNAA